MALPWWPIRVNAEIEPDGLRVVGTQGGEVVPVGSLLPWDRIANGVEPRCRDAEGKPLRIERRPIALRLKKPHRPVHLARAAIAWFADPTHPFRMVIRPGAGRRALIGPLTLLIMVLFFTLWPILFAGGPVSVGDGTGEIGRRADIAANGILLLFAGGALLGVVMFAREVWSIPRRWWIEELNENGLRIRRGSQTDEIAWSHLNDRATGYGTIEIRHIDGRRIRLELIRPAVWAVQARLPKRNRLWSGGFIASLLAALIGPVGIAWLSRWLGVPSDQFGWPQIGFVQVSMLIFPGILLLYWWMSRRETVLETARTNPE